jgi:hypothetical protein
MNTETTPAVFEVLKKFINAKPDLEAANYGCDPQQLAYSSKEQKLAAWRGMRQDARTIQKDGRRARKALREAIGYPFNEKALADAFQGAFSGRLSWDGHRLSYCTGQYYPTEYRAAAATVLEYYCHAVRPKFTPPEGMLFTHIEQIKEASDRAGSHFFSRGAMGFFRSRVLSYVFHGKGGIYFVTSEKGPNEVRAFTIRKFNPVDADIDTFGPFNELTRERAVRLARIASEYPEAALEALGTTKEVPCHQ